MPAARLFMMLANMVASGAVRLHLLQHADLHRNADLDVRCHARCSYGWRALQSWWRGRSAVVGRGVNGLMLWLSSMRALLAQ
jgi:hypothetical protein